MQMEDTHLTQILQAWLPRVGATLSLLASAILLKLVVTKKRIRKLSWADLKTNSRFIFMLGVIEGMHCLTYLASTSAIPKNDTSPGVYGAVGNHSTCTLQGFFVQLGLAAPLYSASLSIFYWLSICRGLSQQDFRKAKIEPLLHGVSIVIPLVTATACAALDIYGPRSSVCWIGMGRTWYTFVFGGIIVLVSWGVIIFCMVYIFVEVKKQTDAMLKYSFSHKMNSPSKADKRMQREKNETAIHAFMAIFIHFFVYILCPFTTGIFDLTDQEVPAILSIVQSTIYSMRGFLTFFTLTRPMIFQAVQGGRASGITMSAAYYKLVFDQRSLVQLMERKPKKQKGSNRRKKLRSRGRKSNKNNLLVSRKKKVPRVNSRGLRFPRGGSNREGFSSGESKQKPRTGTTAATQQSRMVGNPSSPDGLMVNDGGSSMMLSWNPFYLSGDSQQDLQEQQEMLQADYSFSYSANEEQKEEISAPHNPHNSSPLPKRRLYHDDSIVVIEPSSSSSMQGPHHRRRRHSLMSLASVVSEDEQEDIDDGSEEDGLVSTGLMYRRRRSVKGGGMLLHLDEKTRQSLWELDATLSEGDVMNLSDHNEEGGGGDQGRIEKNKKNNRILGIKEDGPCC